MQINTFVLRNYRCFEEIEFTLHPRLNILVGVNGVGKTALLEALRVFVGSIFVEMNKVENKIYSPSILSEDVRLKNLEPQFPASMCGDITISDYLWQSKKKCEWGRTLKTLGGKTIYDNRACILKLSSTIQKKIMEGANEVMPLVAYYSTNRYKKEKRNTGLEADGSRLRGYYNALDTTTNVWFFLDVYKTASLAKLQGRHEVTVIDAVHDTVVSLVPNCTNIWYDVQRDGLYLDMDDGQTLPFYSLSDGVRCMVSMAFELAIRCFLLNPHLGKGAAKETTGVVLIDEIDLHLHPSWQQHVLSDLVNAFPNIQFIVTTHAPMILHSVSGCKIISISDHKVYDFPLQYKREFSAILHDMGGLNNDYCNKLLSDYRKMIEDGKGYSDKAVGLRKCLDKLMGETHVELQRADVMLALYSD